MSAHSNDEARQLRLSIEPERRVFRVTELNAALQQILEADFHGIFVAGEISGCRIATSGHYYFCLKDEKSQVKAVLFKSSARYVKFKPQDGLAVIARGNLEVYEARGEYQLIVESLEPQGAGALQVAFEQLKRRLAAEGLFDSTRKRSLPRLPRRIGIVTSSSGAAIRDILQVLERRFPGLDLRVFPVQVQGEGSVEQVSNGLAYFSNGGWAEVIILTRGGGSIEDLWTFNEEAVARAVASCKVPVISAIGHETDFTICDFVADIRAPTPSAAAEIVICTKSSLVDQIASSRAKLTQAMRYIMLSRLRDLNQKGSERIEAVIHRTITRRAQLLDDLDDRIRQVQRRKLESLFRRLSDLTARLRATELRLRFAHSRHRLELLEQRLNKRMEVVLWKARRREDALRQHLSQLSPLTVLARGYSIVQDQQGHILRVAGEASPGQPIKIRLHRGELDASVLQVREE